MRRPLLLVAGLLVVAAVTIGLLQSDPAPNAADFENLTLAEQREGLVGAPPALAALYAKGNQLLPGDQPEAFRKGLAALKGHPVVVNFWGSWCGPCRAEFPFFQQAVRKYGKRVAFLGVDSADNDGDAREFLSQIPVAYPSYRDPDSKVVQEYGAKDFPVTLFIRADGKVEQLHLGGYASDKAIFDDIEEYLL